MKTQRSKKKTVKKYVRLPKGWYFVDEVCGVMCLEGIIAEIDPKDPWPEFVELPIKSKKK